MQYGWLSLVWLVALGACAADARPVPCGEPKSAVVAPAGASTFSLVRLRTGFRNNVYGESDPTPPVPPPDGVLEIVRYRAPLGEQVAYASPVTDGAKRPAMIWIVGGFHWGVSATAWLEAPRDNDQSARAFREAGMVLMLPALRGMNGNPGKPECFLGEVDDILAAADYLATRPDVDPERIYLGGHSTGGTMALLAAASTDRFRAVFAFGPVATVADYGMQGCLPMTATPLDVVVRSPIVYVPEIVTPTFVIEGRGGNGDSVEVLGQAATAAGNAAIRARVVDGADHFSYLAPISELIARALVTGARIEVLDTLLGAESLQRALRGEPPPPPPPSP